MPCTYIETPKEIAARHNAANKKIINLTLEHYRQKAVFYYMVSSEVKVVYAELTN